MTYLWTICVGVYVDDLVEKMKKLFDMTDLGLFSSHLGLQMKQAKGVYSHVRSLP